MPPRRTVSRPSSIVTPSLVRKLLTPSISHRRHTLAQPSLPYVIRTGTRPSPADPAKTEEALKKFGKTYEFHTYEKAGHAFFAVDREQYRVHAAVDRWKIVFGWFGKYLR